MTRYAAFLRGVNVGGVNLKMAAVVQALQAAGFANVRTMFASGNVLLESRSGTAAVRKNAEQALRSEFGYDAWGTRRFKSSTTTRNLRTIDKVLQKGLAPRTSKSTSRLRKTGTK